MIRQWHPDQEASSTPQISDQEASSTPQISEALMFQLGLILHFFKRDIAIIIGRKERKITLLLLQLISILPTEIIGLLDFSRYTVFPSQSDLTKILT